MRTSLARSSNFSENKVTTFFGFASTVRASLIESLIERAEADHRLVLTLDKDFWQLTLQRREPLRHSGVVLFRVHPAILENLEPLVLAMLRAERHWIGHISVVTTDGIEMISTGTQAPRLP
jgi:predicted nuclease of predicted toxin-antitoxin system